jgi:actin related protein 2/3 complex subunit 4
MNKELLLQPVVVARSANEKCLIEGSVNSVRVSIKIKQLDELDAMLVTRFMNFLQQRAEDFVILRRKAIEGYDISFLLTNFHAEELQRDKLIEFIIHFMSEIDSEIASMKLAVNSRARIVATTFLRRLIS